MIHLTKENFEKEVVQEEKPVIIDFYADWCGPCKMMAPIFKELEKEMPEVKFAKVDTQVQPELAGQFAVRGIPTLALVKGTQGLDKFVGFMPKEALKEKIEQALKKYRLK